MPTQSYKFIDQHTPPELWTGRFFRFDGKVYANPAVEHLLLIGYKPITVADTPEYNIDSQSLSPVFTERDEDILQEWEVGTIEESATE